MASLDCKLLPDHNSVTTRPTHNVKNNQKITLEAPRLQKWLKSANHVKNNSATNHSIFHGSFACSFLAKIFYVATSTFSAIFYVEPKNNNYRLEPCIDSSKTRKDVDHGLQQIIPLSLILGLRNALTVSSPLCQLLCLWNNLRLAQKNYAHHPIAPNRLGFCQSLHPRLLGLPSV